jgi:hypothetical protein
MHVRPIYKTTVLAIIEVNLWLSHDNSFPRKFALRTLLNEVNHSCTLFTYYTPYLMISTWSNMIVECWGFEVKILIFFNENISIMYGVNMEVKTSFFSFQRISIYHW